MTRDETKGFRITTQLMGINAMGAGEAALPA